MKAWDADIIIAALKCKLREAKEAGNTAMAAFTDGCLTILRDMPTMEVQDGIDCSRCYFHDKDTHHCIHNKGLPGRIGKGMFCSYADCTRGDYTDDYEDDDFSEFDEEDGE